MVFSSAAHLDGMFIDMHNFHDMMQRLITSVPDLYCFGYLACYHANISNFDQVFCRGYYSCRFTRILYQIHNGCW